MADESITKDMTLVEAKQRIGVLEAQVVTLQTTLSHLQWTLQNIEVTALDAVRKHIRARRL